MLYLRQSTAGQTILIGPFIDKDDGVTPETALTINAADIRLSANGGNMFPKTSGGGTHDEEGFYLITLDATDSATVGHLQISVQDATTHLPVYHELTVLEENVYDAWHGASAAAGTDLASVLADTGELQVDDYPTRFSTLEALVNDIGSGAAGISVIAESSVETVAGAPTNTYAVTDQLDGVYHIVPDDGADDTDMYYQFDITEFGVPIEVEWVGYAQGVNETYGVYFWNWGGSTWDQVHTLVGTALTTQQTHAFSATTSHVGTGGDVGKVRLRFLSADGAVIATDRILCDYAVVLDTSVASILADTNELQTDDVPGLIAALNNLSAAAVATEISDALRTDTLTATPQGAPPTTPTLQEALMVLYDALVHAVDVTATSKEFKNDGGTVIWKKALSDNGTTYTEAESATGP